MQKYKNRFQKFYQLNKDKINRARRARYKKNKRTGICTRCKRKALKGMRVCSYHRKKQHEYNTRR